MYLNGLRPGMLRGIRFTPTRSYAQIDRRSDVTTQASDELVHARLMCNTVTASFCYSILDVESNAHLPDFRTNSRAMNLIIEHNASSRLSWVHGDLNVGKTQQPQLYVHRQLCFHQGMACVRGRCANGQSVALTVHNRITPLLPHYCPRWSEAGGNVTSPAMIRTLPTALQQHLRHNKTDLSGLYVHMIASCAGILILSQGCCGVTLFAVSLDDAVSLTCAQHNTQAVASPK